MKRLEPVSIVRVRLVDGASYINQFSRRKFWGISSICSCNDEQRKTCIIYLIYAFDVL